MRTLPILVSLLLTVAIPFPPTEARPHDVEGSSVRAFVLTLNSTGGGHLWFNVTAHFATPNSSAIMITFFDPNGTFAGGAGIVWGRNGWKQFGAQSPAFSGRIRFGSPDPEVGYLSVYQDYNLTRYDAGRWLVMAPTAQVSVEWNATEGASMIEIPAHGSVGLVDFWHGTGELGLQSRAIAATEFRAHGRSQNSEFIALLSEDVDVTFSPGVVQLALTVPSGCVLKNTVAFGTMVQAGQSCPTGSSVRYSHVSASGMIVIDQAHGDWNAQAMLIAVAPEPATTMLFWGDVTIG